MSEWGDQLNNWTLSGSATYVMLKENSPVEDVTDKIENIMGVYREGSDNKLRLQPFDDIYLHSNHLENSIRIQGNIEYIYIFSIIGCFIILIACINFVNLSMAKSSVRAREIGIRKAVGARKMQLMGQLICESILVVEIAIMISLVCVELLIPVFNELSGKAISLSLINSPNIIAGYLLFGVILGILSGIYPAMVLTKFQPVKVLKGQSGVSQSNVQLRRVLVVFQFTLSILLIIGTIIVSNQLSFMQNKNLGFDKDQLISVKIRGDISEHLELFKTELTNEHNILSVCAVSNKPTHGRFFTASSTDWEGRNDDQKVVMSFVAIDYDYIKTFNMKMSDGAYYSRDLATDTANGIVLNETAVRAMGIESPIGKRFSFNDNDLNIIGVVKDYSFQSLYHNIEPLALAFIPQMYRYLYVKISPNEVLSTLATIETIYGRFASGHPFEYKFLNEDYEMLYAKERKMNTIFIYFTVLAIVIASMGLFGLVSFVAEKRTREIGIHKVLGASVSSIANMITKEFVLLTVISNLIAWPIAYYFTNKWLNGFAYRIEYEVSTFLITCIFALAITLLSVGYRAIKAATSNPIYAIRQE